MILQEGDLVVVHKPSNRFEEPEWVPEMDRYEDATMVVREVWTALSGETYVHLDDCTYSFNQKWLEKENTTPPVDDGDVVIVHKPVNVNESPTWAPGMDKYDGSTMIVERTSGPYVALYDCPYGFNKKWLEPVDDEEYDATPTDGEELLALLFGN